MSKYLPIIMLISNFLLINLSFLLVLYIYPILNRPPWIREFWLFINLSYIVPAYLYHRINISIRSLPLDRAYVNALKQVALFALTFMMLTQIVHADISLKIYATLIGIVALALPLWTILSARILKLYRSHGRNYARVVIIGANPTAARLINEMRSDAGFGYNIIGCFSADCPDGFPCKHLGDIDSLAEYARENPIDEIYFTLSGDNHSILKRAIKIADDNVALFYYVPQISRYLNRKFRVHNIGAIPVLTSDSNPLKSPVNKFIKRSFDIAFSSLVLLFSPIIFIPVAIGIKLTSPGPVFFSQKRTGLNGEPFNCLKFRTMRVNKDADSVQATKNDPRKTAFGDFLRRTSIDELPQFINVLKGDMSVVGPRPHMLIQTEDYTKVIDKYMVRHVIKPGITGWAQVNGYRGITDQLWKMERRVEYDVWYIEHWSFALDLKIIVRTMLNAIGGEKNAF